MFLSFDNRSEITECSCFAYKGTQSHMLFLISYMFTFNNWHMCLLFFFVLILFYIFVFCESLKIIPFWKGVFKKSFIMYSFNPRLSRLYLFIYLLTITS